MSHSFSYNGINLANYNLSVISSSRDDMGHEFDSRQLEDRAYASSSKLLPGTLNFDVAIIGHREDIMVLPPIVSLGVVNLLSHVRKVINQDEACQLIISFMSDRYWMAKFRALIGGFLAPTYYRGTMEFFCPDSRAYSVDEITHSYNIDADPKTFNVHTNGTAFMYPVYTLTAGENLVAVLIKVKNNDTDEEITWAGDLAIGEVLTIDTEYWLVKKEGVASMDTVGGEFPRLKPAQGNSMTVTGFGALGTLDITYRERFI